MGDYIEKKVLDLMILKKVSSKNITNDWLVWFIGLYEGDGSMYFSNKGFSFAIYSIDKKTLLEIKRVLGFGNIYYDALNIKWRYLVESRYEVYLILLILNGNLVLTHRYFNFISIAQEFNQRFFNGKIFISK